jgi:hypothetical protein
MRRPDWEVSSGIALTGGQSLLQSKRPTLWPSRSACGPVVFMTISSALLCFSLRVQLLRSGDIENRDTETHKEKICSKQQGNTPRQPLYHLSLYAVCTCGHLHFSQQTQMRSFCILMEHYCICRVLLNGCSLVRYEVVQYGHVV